VNRVSLKDLKIVRNENVLNPFLSLCDARRSHFFKFGQKCLLVLKADASEPQKSNLILIVSLFIHYIWALH